MDYSSQVDGFRLAYDRVGSGAPVVLLHGWPGDHTDYRKLAPLLADSSHVVVPDLRGFGMSDKHLVDPEKVYSAAGQARGVIALMDELGLTSAVLAGYDVGSLVAQTVAAMRPDLVRALVVSPPLPGAGKRILDLKEAKEFWYTTFHQQEVAVQLLDGKPEDLRAYLRHFWSHWSGPNYIIEEDALNHLVEVYSQPGAFTASLGWYRCSSNPVTAYTAETTPVPADRLTVPTTVLWQELDPIFPTHWSDRLDEYFVDVTLEPLPGVGHYTPLEASAQFADAIKKRLLRP
ncbi:MAG: alpha/beta fold hydrolase [Gemmataceae bacterium]